MDGTHGVLILARIAEALAAFNAGDANVSETLIAIEQAMHDTDDQPRREAA